MKNYLILIVTAILVFIAPSLNAQTDYDTKALKTELYQLLKPNYRYDKSNVSVITVKNAIQGGEIGVPILNTESYRLLFNTAGFPSLVDIKIYDKPLGDENRKLLFSSKEDGNDKSIFMYTPSFKHFTTIYVDYIVPATTDKSLLGKKGCVVFLMGYKIG